MENTISPSYLFRHIAPIAVKAILHSIKKNSSIRQMEYSLEKSSIRNAEDWLLQLDYSASKPSEIQEQQQRRLEMVKEVLINVLPGVREIRFDPSSGVIPTPKVEFNTYYGWVPLRQLGFGYRTMIAWVVDLAARMIERYPDSPDPLAEPAVVLVDEIDLHLHTKWQPR